MKVFQGPGFGRKRTEHPAPAPDVQGPSTAAPERAPEEPPRAPAPAPPPPAARPPARQELRAACLARIDPASVASLPPDALMAEVERLIAEIADAQRIGLSGREQRGLATELVDDMLGLGPLAPLLEDESITDIMVNGPHRVFVEQRGRVSLSSARFRDNAHLGGIAQRIAAAVGRRIDESSPMVDARLADGSRVNIVFPPLALNGPCLSIRKFAKGRIGFEQMVAGGSVTPAMARVLEIAARCRLNVIVSGGTGSGKTTLLNALSRLIDHGERIVTVEDAAELQLQQPHVVRLETRPANLEGRGEITQRDLIRNALRMRPDRIILGECRGAEAFDMLQAMNTGHDGSMSTIHANNTRDAVTRVENMVLMGQANLPPRAIRTQITSAVDLIVQVERMRDGVRRVTQVTEVQGLEGEVVVLHDIFQWSYEGEALDGRLRGSYRVSRARPAFAPRLAYFEMERAWAAALEPGAEP
ncbi:CpaF family protein [Roseomonas sp. NAR14]|uniref:CpaF family protein n=1 Tax=Roseomonas acroporae TaxID=2937791 RepID=A0A9X1Y909_9PROT|nr:CpaF family protein [Roseomonas acroporae]MCK8785748.1 CpaF family protein [Roseomonas acroporae]